MDEELEVSQEYKKAFNEGYLLYSELGMKPDALKDISAGGDRIKAMAKGMEQYEIDQTDTPNKSGIDKEIDIDNLIPERSPSQDKNKGLDK